MAAKPRPRRPLGDSRPPAPWGSFPLVELVVAVALVMLVAGFFIGGSRGSVLLITGFALGSLAGLELSVREHFAGYRSHTLLLAGFVAAIVLAALFYVAPDDVPVVVRLVIAGIVFAGSARILSLMFERRAGVLNKVR